MIYPLRIQSVPLYPHTQFFEYQAMIRPIHFANINLYPAFMVRQLGMSQQVSQSLRMIREMTYVGREQFHLHQYANSFYIMLISSLLFDLTAQNILLHPS